MKKESKYTMRIIAYLPFQILLVIVYSPILALIFAYENAECLAYENTYFTPDNPMVNKEGPTRKRMKKHCWLIRFLFPWL